MSRHLRHEAGDKTIWADSYSISARFCYRTSPWNEARGIQIYGKRESSILSQSTGAQIPEQPAYSCVEAEYRPWSPRNVGLNMRKSKQCLVASPQSVNCLFCYCFSYPARCTIRYWIANCNKAEVRVTNPYCSNLSQTFGLFIDFFFAHFLHLSIAAVLMQVVNLSQLT